MKELKKYQKILRVLKKAVLWMLAIFFSGILLSWILVLIFEKDVIRFATEKLNNQLQSEISFESVDLTLLKTFPYASLEFKNVACTEYYPSKKTPDDLFKASYLYLQFNLWDLFSGTYSVKRITLRNADINLYRDKKGVDNWHIWKESAEKSKEKEKFSFRLSSVKMDKVRIKYSDLKSDVKASASISTLFFSGNFTQDDFKLSVETDMQINNLDWADVHFPESLSVNLKSTLQVNVPSQKYTVTYGALTLNSMKLSCEGLLQDGENGLFTDLRFEGNRLDISSVLDLIPEKFSGFRQHYDGSGTVQLNGNLKGIVSEGEVPQFTVQFSGENIAFTAVAEKIKAKNIHFSGSFSYTPSDTKQPYAFTLDSFRGNLPMSELSGKISILGTANPQIQFAVNTRSDLAELFTFFSVPGLDYISGTLHADLSGQLSVPSDFRVTEEELSKAKLLGVAEFSDVAFSVRKSPFTLEKVNGRLEFNQQNVTVKELSGFVSGNDFAIRGELLNLPAYILLPRQPLTIRADLESATLQAERFLSAGDGATPKSEPNAMLPEWVSLELEARINKFIYKRFEAQDVKAKIILKNRVLAVEQVRMKTLGGDVFLNAVADNSSGKGFAIACNGNLNDILVNDLFYRFEDFGQDALTHENVKGKLNAFVEFKGFFNTQLKPDMASLYMKCDLEIDNGELNQFEPLKALSGWAKVDELGKVRFAKLKNTVYIKDEAVLIPQMAIYSNALDIHIAGEHRFDNVVEYGFNLFLGDILANKFRLNRRPDKQGEFGELIPDKGRTRLFVKMSGPMDNLKFSYDKSAVKDKIMQDISTEKGNVKNILDSEFGKIKNDSLLKNDPYYRQKNEKREKKKKESAGGGDFEFE
ncbi:MAG: hypothetical protein MH137_09100 [Flavobacteriales bacterium]|nr:hypothetical protein [Flavobacteriales bacterium]